MSRYFDKGGKPLELPEWGRMLEDRAYSLVAQTQLLNGRVVSTVWMGLDHAFGRGPPLIFETMVFPPGGSADDMDCERYSTEEEAKAGHEAMVAKWSTKQ
jgi:hypothetical protein